MVIGRSTNHLAEPFQTAYMKTACKDPPALSAKLKDGKFVYNKDRPVYFWNVKSGPQYNTLERDIVHNVDGSLSSEFFSPQWGAHERIFLNPEELAMSYFRNPRNLQAFGGRIFIKLSRAVYKFQGAQFLNLAKTSEREHDEKLLLYIEKDEIKCKILSIENNFAVSGLPPLNLYAQKNIRSDLNLIWEKLASEFVIEPKVANPAALVKYKEWAAEHAKKTKLLLLMFPNFDGSEELGFRWIHPDLEGSKAPNNSRYRILARHEKLAMDYFMLHPEAISEFGGEVRIPMTRNKLVVRKDVEGIRVEVDGLHAEEMKVAFVYDPEHGVDLHYQNIFGPSFKYLAQEDIYKLLEDAPRKLSKIATLFSRFLQEADAESIRHSIGSRWHATASCHLNHDSPHITVRLGVVSGTNPQWHLYVSTVTPGDQCERIHLVGISGGATLTLFGRQGDQQIYQQPTEQSLKATMKKYKEACNPVKEPRGPIASEFACYPSDEWYMEALLESARDIKAPIDSAITKNLDDSTQDSTVSYFNVFSKYVSRPLLFSSAIALCIMLGRAFPSLRSTAVGSIFTRIEQGLWVSKPHGRNFGR